MNNVHIRTTLDGNAPVHELIVNGQLVYTFRDSHELLEFLLNGMSGLRYSLPGGM